MGGNADKVDPLADKAEKLLNKAEELSKDNSEIYVVKKLIASLRMLGDVRNRYMTYGPVAAEALEPIYDLWTCCGRSAGYCKKIKPRKSESLCAGRKRPV